jgi:hypothetical protein
LWNFKYTYSTYNGVIIIRRRVFVVPAPVVDSRVALAFVYIVSFTWGNPHVLINLYSRSLAGILQCFARIINKLYTRYAAMSDEKWHPLPMSNCDKNSG